MPWGMLMRALLCRGHPTDRPSAEGTLAPAQLSQTGGSSWHLLQPVMAVEHEPHCKGGKSAVQYLARARWQAGYCCSGWARGQGSCP